MGRPGREGPAVRGPYVDPTPALLRPPVPPRFASDERVRLALRTVVHLSQLDPPVLASAEAPQRSTQQGIALALSATQGAVSKVLRRLIAGGLVRWERRHVAGRYRRVRVYFLTPDGGRIASEAWERLPTLRADRRGSPGSERPPPPTV